MKSVRVGIIGAGTMGERHCRVCANLPHVELVGVADLDKDRGRQITERYDTTHFPDHRALLPQLDAVTIAASTPTHYALTGVHPKSCTDLSCVYCDSSVN
jgi:predicted dehydrogenase